VSDPDHIYNEFFSLDPANYPIITYTIFPKSGKFSSQGSPEPPGIIFGCNPVSQITNDAALDIAIKFSKIILSIGVELNLPSQAFSPVRQVRSGDCFFVYAP
jgi:hypothetical protein